MIDVPPVAEWQVGEATGEARVGVEMISGWRRFCTRAYWRCQWLAWRGCDRPLNIVAVGTLTILKDAD